MDLNLSGSSCLSSRPNTLGVKLQLRFDKDVGTFLIRNILHSPEFSFFFQFWKWFLISTDFSLESSQYSSATWAGNKYQLFCCRIFANRSCPANIGTAPQLAVDAALLGLGRLARLWSTVSAWACWLLPSAGGCTPSEVLQADCSQGHCSPAAERQSSSELTTNCVFLDCSTRTLASTDGTSSSHCLTEPVVVVVTLHSPSITRHFRVQSSQLSELRHNLIK